MEHLKLSKLSKHQYGDHELQRISVWAVATSGYWVIYIHGGAWRDPTITDETFIPAIKALTSPTHAQLINSSVAAFASIDYRLSPHPSRPQESTTPSSQLRNARHPDHIQDVRSAIALLQEKYGFGDNYLLLGHSCGATLALQAIMDPAALGVDSDLALKQIQLPKAVLGVCGIYDLKIMVENHSTISVYRDFVESAFGDEKKWSAVSPARYDRYAEWQSGKLLVLVSSSGDELIEDAQIIEMSKTLESWHKKDDRELLVLRNELKQAHDGIWSNGDELAKVISISLMQLRKIDQ